MCRISNWVNVHIHIRWSPKFQYDGESFDFRRFDRIRNGSWNRTFFIHPIIGGEMAAGRLLKSISGNEKGVKY